LNEVARKATDHLLTNKDFYASIDRSINNITHVWLRDYFNEAKSNRTAYIAFAVLMGFWIFFLLRFIKAFDPYTKPLLKKWKEK
jgi:hypothetical protein